MIKQYSISNLEKIPFYFIRKIRFPFDGQPVNCSLSLPYVDITFSEWDTATKVCKQVY